MILVFAAAATLAELCRAAPAPAATRDVTESATYADVGDEARAKQDLVIAATAYRKALALDPTNRRAAEALRAICKDTTSTDHEAALLDAIARYQRGDYDGAREIVAGLAQPNGDLPNGAHFLLGLIALEDHDRATAERELSIARRDPAYATLAYDLLRLARRDGTIATTLIVASEVDSNPQQLPDTPPMGATSGPREGDASLLVAGAVTLRPSRWLAIRNVLAWRKQRELDELDFLGETAQVALDLDRGPNRAALRYDFDYDLVGGESYLVAHRGTGGFRRDLGQVEFGVTASIRRREYRQSDQAGFTGWVYSGDAGALVHLGTRVDLDVKAIGWREDNAEPIFATIAGGGQVAIRARPASRFRIAVQTSAWYARYDAPAADGVHRRDTHLEATADLELDLADHMILVAGVSAARNESTVDDFRYWKLVARCGLAFAIGGP